MYLNSPAPTNIEPDRFCTSDESSKWRTRNSLHIAVVSGMTYFHLWESARPSCHTGHGACKPPPPPHGARQLRSESPSALLTAGAGACRLGQGEVGSWVGPRVCPRVRKNRSYILSLPGPGSTTQTAAKAPASFWWPVGTHHDMFPASSPKAAQLSSHSKMEPGAGHRFN